MIDVYKELAEVIDTDAMKAPKENGEFVPSFIEYLKLLYSPEEAEYVVHLLLVPNFRSVSEVAALAGADEQKVADVLVKLNQEGSLVGMGDLFAIPLIPVLINIHTFYPEFKENDVKAGELYQDFFIKKKYSKNYESSAKGTAAVRSLPVREAIQAEEKVLTAEDAEDFIMHLDTDDIVLTECVCRSRTEKLGIRECKGKFPIGHCIMLGFSALYFESIGVGKRATKEETVAYVREMTDLGLTCTTDNALTKNSVICLCCECCCSQVRGVTRWDNPDAVAPSNFIPKVDSDICKFCGLCVKRCPFCALSKDEENKRIVVNTDVCRGCGICALKCPTGAIKLYREERAPTPLKTASLLRKTMCLENNM